MWAHDTSHDFRLPELENEPFLRVAILAQAPVHTLDHPYDLTSADHFLFNKNNEQNR